MIDWKGSGKTVEQLNTLKEAAKVYTNQFARVAKAAEARGHKLGEAQGLRRAYIETAKWKFGADAAERLADVLADVTDRTRLARVGRLVLECETGDDLIAKAAGN